MVCNGGVYLHTLRFRLNSRDYIRDRGPNKSDSSFALSSIRVEPPGEVFWSQSKQTGTSVNFHRPPFDSIHPNTEQIWLNMWYIFELEGPKLVRSLHFTFLARDQIDAYPSWRIQASLLNAIVVEHLELLHDHHAALGRNFLSFHYSWGSLKDRSLSL